MSNYAGEPKRRGLALTIVGAVMMLVLAPAAFVVGTVFGVKGAVDLVQSAPMVTSGGSVAMSVGQTRDIYAYVGASSSDSGIETDSTLGESVPACKVTSPSGADVPVSSATGNTSWTRDGGRYGSAGSFTAEEAGDHAVDCGSASAIVPDGDQASEAATKAAWGIGGGLIGATIIGILGLIMLIIGIVKLVNSGKERSQFRMQQQMGQWNNQPRW